MPTGDYDAIKDTYKRKIFIGIVDDAGFNFLNLNKEYNAKWVLKQSHVVKKLYNPSLHVSDTPNRNSNALDIRILEIDGIKYKETADVFYNKHRALGYGGGSRSDHHHLNYRKQS